MSETEHVENGYADARPTHSPPLLAESWQQRARRALLGNYDWRGMCMPQLPWKMSPTSPQSVVFFAKDERLSLLVALVLGFQHFLGMSVGLITPPLLVANLAGNSPDAQRIKQYMLSASLIVSGLATMVQVYSVRVWPDKGIRLGSGLLSTMGITIVFVSISQGVLHDLMRQGESFREAFGAVAGTIVLVSPVPLLLSFVPPKWLHRIFNESVIGMVIVLVGISLVGVGFQYWGGGSFCAEHPDQLCRDTGAVHLPFGSLQYIGLGFSVFATIVVIELFGSPFLRNASIMVGLLVGYLLALTCTHEGARYVSLEPFRTAPVFTFLWTYTFPLRVYPAAILPALMGILITSVETLGDVTATEEASLLLTSGPDHDAHIKGGLMNDGAMTLLAGLSGVLPITTFAQNNGIIAITRCASRDAGYAAGFWLICAGLLGKFGAFILSTPHCVLGGATSFLFANVAVSGIRILMSDPLTRRNRFIAAAQGTFGLGVTLVPKWATHALWPQDESASAFAKGVHQSVMLILSTGFVVGCLVGVLLNILIPEELDVHMLLYDYQKSRKRLEQVVMMGTNMRDSAQEACVMVDPFSEEYQLLQAALVRGGHMRARQGAQDPYVSPSVKAQSSKSLYSDFMRLSNETEESSSAEHTQHGEYRVLPGI